LNKFPIDYFKDNLVFNSNGDCWAGYKLINFDYTLKKSDQKFDILRSMSRFLSNAGFELQILIVPTIIDCTKQLEKLKKSKTDDITILANESIDKTAEYLEEKCQGSVNEYEVYLFTNLEEKGDLVTTIRDFLSYAIKEPLKAFNNIFGVDTKDIPKRKLKYYKEFAEEFFRRQSERINIEPVNTQDIEMLIKRAFLRGLTDDVQMRDGWEPGAFDEGESIKPHKRDVLTLSEGIFKSENRILTIEHEDGVSYQTFIAISHLPDMEFPGCEFFLYLQCLGFPVECAINIANIEHTKALKKVDDKRNEVNGQIEHIIETNEDIPNSLIQAKDSIDDLESDLIYEKMPLMDASIVICVYSDNLDELVNRYKAVKDLFTDLSFHTQRPRADQELFFMEFLPGAGRYIKDFNLLLPPKTLAGSMFGATTNLGDNKGNYIGYTSNLEKPVFLSLLHACQLNKSPAAFVWGSLGYGKSFNTNLLVYLHVLSGARAFIIDPKSERKHWIETLPELSEHVSITTFGNNVEDIGKLDPFLIYEDDINAAGNLAVNIVAEIFDLKVSDDRHTVLVEAIQRMKVSGDVPCMQTLVETLESFPAADELHSKAKNLARMIKTLEKPGLSGLLYGNRQKKKGLGFKNVINIVEINGLQLPLSNKSKDYYTTEEKLSTVLMLAVANYARQFSQMDNSIQKIVVLDESWSLARTEEGKNLFEILARTGRSLNTSTIFIGHSASDIPTEGIRNAITYKFCFNLNNRDEAVESLKLLDMENSEENIKMLATSDGLANGECIFCDAYGRKGVITFEAVSKHLINAFGTTPGEEVV